MSATTVVVSSRVDATPERVWAHVRTMEGVNHELAPFVRMHVPPRARGLVLEDAPLGSVAFRSTLLAFGVVPFDRHALCLVEVRPGHGFRERSSSLLQRRWEHERTIAASGDGAEVTDRVTFDPRGAPAALVRPLVAALFGHRHRRLRVALASPARARPPA